MTKKVLPHRIAALCCGIALCATASGCQWTGLNSISLPGTQGHGPGSYHVTIAMPDVTTITPNSPVLVNDVEVGSITAITTENWHARVTVALNGDVHLPADVTATIGQTSLLGTTHIELTAPPDPHGVLTDGAQIPLERAGRYPTTEQTLAALSTVLNGGGLGQIQTLVTESNKALAGHENSAGQVIDQLSTLLTRLDSGHDAIAATIDNLDRLATGLTQDSDTIDKAIAALDPALGVAAAQRKDLTAALAALTRFGDVGTALLEQTHDDLKKNLADLAPTLEKVSEAGDDLIAHLSDLGTFPFPQAAIDDGMRGDYTNLWAEADLTLPRLQQGLLFGTPLAAPAPVAGDTAGGGR